MKANELRIGNYVWDDYSGEMIVCAILESSAIYLQKTIKLPSGEYLIKDIEPIPLTEEWLLKFGFKQPYDDMLTIFTKDIKESPFEDDFRIEEREEVGCYMIDDYYVKVKYVHQLQNLYFALTGSELILNEHENAQKN